MSQFDTLDRPVWNMLTGPQAHLAVARGAAVRIDPGYGPFAAARDGSDEAQAALAALIAPGETVWLVEPEEWSAPPGTRVVRTAALAQMAAEAPQAPRPGDEPGDLLREADGAAMTALALATEPGPWGERTRCYGDFFGLRRDGRLAAMAGERMRPAPRLAEVSAVCTWPEFRGQGLAGMLIRQVMAGFTARGDTPFLHSYAGNAGAIRLYESLGFAVRREMVVTVLALDET
ncbi:MAG: GNAT family N-acetyltransferase [Novosphingobium sp.]